MKSSDLRNIPNLLFCQFGNMGRNEFLHTLLGNRKTSLLYSQKTICVLEMNRNGIMDAAVDVFSTSASNRGVRLWIRIA
jgi:hypothetical protein